MSLSRCSFVVDSKLARDVGGKGKATTNDLRCVNSRSEGLVGDQQLIRSLAPSRSGSSRLLVLAER